MEITSEPFLHDAADLPDKWLIVPVHMSLLKEGVIGQAHIHRQHRGGITGLHEFQVHEQAPGAAIPIHERMNLHEFAVHTGGPLHGMQGHRLVTVP